MNDNNLTLQQLLKAIELYFDCSLTDEQEMGLRHEIAMTPYSHPAIDEAKAVMGIRATSAKKDKKSEQAKNKFTQKILPSLSIAASIALIITLGVIFAIPQTPEHTCVAYVNGKKVTDEDAVIALMSQNIDELHDGANEVRQTLVDDLKIIAPAVDKYDTNLNPFEI